VEGQLHLPRREDPFVPRVPRGQALQVLWVRRVRGRLQVPAEADGEGVPGGRAGARGGGRRRDSGRRGRVLRGARAPEGEERDPRRERSRGPLLDRAARHPLWRLRAPVPPRSRGERGVDSDVPARRRRAGVERPRAQAEGEEDRKAGAREGGAPRREGRRRRLRSLPRAAHVPDRPARRADHRVRRPRDGRGEGGEVPQHPRDPALQEEQGALRARSRPGGDPQDAQRGPTSRGTST
jgi:hypothetical protein